MNKYDTLLKRALKNGEKYSKIKLPTDELLGLIREHNSLKDLANKSCGDACFICLNYTSKKKEIVASAKDGVLSGKCANKSGYANLNKITGGKIQ